MDNLFSGTRPEQLDLLEMASRAIVVFLVTLVSLRLGSKRFLGRYSAFDWVSTIILGSVLSRAINGSAPFLPTLGIAPIFTGLHWLLGAAAVRSPTFDRLLQGRPSLLVSHGEMDGKAARRAHITLEDILEELRYQVHTGQMEDIEAGTLERNGRISVISRLSDRAVRPQ